MNDMRPLPPQPGEPTPNEGEGNTEGTHVTNRVISNYPPPGAQYPQSNQPQQPSQPQQPNQPPGQYAAYGQPGYGQPGYGQPPQQPSWSTPHEQVPHTRPVPTQLPSQPTQLPQRPDQPGQHAAYGAGAYPAYPGYQPQQTPQRKSRGWLVALGGGLAGAALGVAIVLPVALNTGDGSDEANGGNDGDRTGETTGAQRDIDDLVERGGTEEVTDDGVLLVSTQVGNGEGAGTAMVLTEDGLALTNYHVVDGSEEVEVTVAATEEEFTAEVLGYNAAADVALLQLEDASGLDTVTIDDDEGVDVGDGVTALGNAGGQGFLSEVTGQVTGLDEDITTTDQFNGNRTDIEGLIETDADVVPGYSGGPMFDDEGEVIGISTAAASTNGDGPMAAPGSSATTDGGGISYARPIEEALDVAQAILDEDAGDGVVVGRAAYLGVGIDPSGGDVLVAQAEEGTPAAEAGIEEGDVITEINGERVSSYDELAAAISSFAPGEDVEVTWERDGEEQTATVTLGESPTN